MLTQLVPVHHRLGDGDAAALFVDGVVEVGCIEIKQAHALLTLASLFWQLVMTVGMATSGAPVWVAIYWGQNRRAVEE